MESTIPQAVGASTCYFLQSSSLTTSPLGPRGDIPGIYFGMARSRFDDFGGRLGSNNGEQGETLSRLWLSVVIRVEPLDQPSKYEDLFECRQGP